MNDILSLKVDDTLEHGTRAKTVQTFVLKTCRNEKYSERFIINLWAL